MIVKNGTADVTTYFVLRDSTNHAPKTDVTITDIDLYYVEDGAAISTKADATALAAADSAHSDNKAFHVGQGLYRIDWPDAAFDGGIGKRVQLIVVCTGVDTTFYEVELSSPVNVVAISDDSTAADNLETATDGGSYNIGGGGVVAASVTGAVGSVTGNVGGNVAGSVASVTAAVTVGTNNDKTGYALSAAGVQAIWDALSSALTTVGSIGKRLVDYLTGDIFARIGAPAGASVSADVAAVKSDTAAIKAKTDNLPASPAAVGSAMTLADDAITAAKFDESTAFPVKSADTGSTQIARVGADGDTLEVLSDQIDTLTGPLLTTKAEVTSKPTATAGLVDKLAFSFHAMTQKRAFDSDTGTETIYQSNGSSQLATRNVTETATTQTFDAMS